MTTAGITPPPVAEDRYRQLFQELPIGMFLSTPDGRFLDVNRAFAELLRAPAPEELLLRRTLDFWVRPEERQRLFVRLSAEGFVSGFVMQVRRWDGTVGQLVLDVHAVRQNGDGLLHAEGAARDVTAELLIARRLAAQQAVGEILARAETLAEAAVPVLRVACEAPEWDVGELWSLDATGGRLELGGAWYVDGVAFAAFRRATEGRTFAEGEGLPGRIWRDGRPTWVECAVAAGPLIRSDAATASGLRSAFGVPVRVSGQVVGVLAFFSRGEAEPDGEMTRMLEHIAGQLGQFVERRRAEQALRRSESRFRSLIEHARDLVAILDARGVMQYASPSHEAILGYQPDELVGRDALECVHPEDRDRVRSAMAEGLASGAGTVPLQTFRYRHRDGSYRMIEALATNLLRDPDIHGIVVNSRDVSERLGLEAELRQAQKMEAVGRLAGGVAHDFNNLLTVISANTEFLIDALGAQDPRRADAEEIRSAAQRATTLTRQLLAFSRRQILQPTTLNLADVVQDLGKMLRRLIGEDVDLQLAPDPEAPLVNADPGQLEQVLMNLAVNARDAMPEGGTLRIGTGRRRVTAADVVKDGPPVGEWAALDVSDTGAGMPPDVLERIFEPFFTTKEHGTGLGLATVYGIVKQSGGFITVDSAPGAGTTFRIHLPESTEGAPAGSPATSGHAGRIAGSGSVSILLVEDDPRVRAQGRRVLAGAGYRVLDAGSGADALQVAEAEDGRIDLLLTDVVMPRMNGRQLAERLHGRWPSMRVLYTSGYTDEIVDRHGVLAPGVWYLPKPYTPEAIQRKVAQVLEQEAEGAQPPTSAR